MCGALAIAATVGCDSPSSRPIVPATTGFSRTGPRIDPVTKLDLLFVVDNSPSMADAQAELARSVPSLLATLTDHAKDPNAYVDPDPIDIHVGVITSSLGSHGTSICASAKNPHRNDHAHLLPRDGSCSVAASSAVAWTYAPQTGTSFVGSEGAAKLATATTCVVRAADDDGCSYQETWEAAYHFLVDPKPYASAEVECTLTDLGDACGSNKIQVAGVDEGILAQRKAFLRQDSLLAVVVLSNENDVSLKPAGLNWLLWGYGKGTMQRGWTNCPNVPDDFEPESKADFDLLHSMYACKSCFEDGSDPNCKTPWPPTSANLDVDDRNLRGFAQTQRFGYNFLWGRQRYVQAFTNPQAVASDGSLGVNPIFAGGFRTKDLVLVQAIVGVPDRLVSDGDWNKMIGPVGERDPHMIESIAPRAGIPRFAGDRAIDDVNGGDRDVPAGDELQYACISKRRVPKHSNTCKAPGSDLRDPVCDGERQTYAAAFPGLRHLRIVHDLGASGLVASICNESFVPALTALGRKIEERMSARCIDSEIGVVNGRAACVLFEVMRDEAGGVTCEQLGKGLCTLGAAPCRIEGSENPPVPLATAAQQLALPVKVTDPSTGDAQDEYVDVTVDGANAVVVGSDLRKHLVCELLQLAPPDPNATLCQTEKKFVLDPSQAGGWCYTTNPALLSPSCTLGSLRFAGGAIPREGAEIHQFCASQ
jgi:hypothetical protein